MTDQAHEVEVVVAADANALGVPGTLTETGYSLPEGLSFEMWEAIGEHLQRVERCSRWWIGDWIAYGERKWGEMYAQAIETTGHSYGSLANAVYVSSRIDISRRRENLSWSHHQEVAALEPADQKAWLDRTEVEGWTVRELRSHVALAKRAAKLTGAASTTSRIEPEQPIRSLSTDPLPAALTLPLNPTLAAQVLVETFDIDFIAALRDELTRLLA